MTDNYVDIKSKSIEEFEIQNTCCNSVRKEVENPNRNDRCRQRERHTHTHTLRDRERERERERNREIDR